MYLRFFLVLAFAACVSVFALGEIPLETGANVLFYGNSLVERLGEQGELEAWVQLARPEADLHFRSLAWTGDEVGNRQRAEGYAEHLKNLLALWPSKMVVVGFGMNEAFAGEAGLTAFRAQWEIFLKQLA